MDVINLLQRSEGKTLEFKRDLSSPKGVLKSLIAFANTSGGTLLIGVEDKTKSVRGVSQPLDLEERLANLISDHIAPHLVPDLEIVPWRHTYLIAINIYPSPSRPHYLKNEGPDAGVYVRVGSTNRKADKQLIGEMSRYTRADTPDEQPMPELNSEEVDFRVASELFSEHRKLRRADLETLRLITSYQGHKVPTVGGILLFGRDRNRHFPDAWIQTGRFSSGTKSHIVDQSEIRSPLPLAVEEAIKFVEKHTQQGLEIRGARHKKQWTIPPIAIREAIINAVVHADYLQQGAPIRIAIFDDRIEVENPGLLPLGLTIEDLQRGISKLRNRVIGRVFHELGLIEQWGSGIQRMTNACHEAGLAPPVLEEIGLRFRVTLYSESVKQPVINKTDQLILDALQTNTGLLTHEIATEIGLSTRATRTRLAKLVERGLVREIGTSPQDPKRRYLRTK